MKAANHRNVWFQTGLGELGMLRSYYTLRQQTLLLNQQLRKMQSNKTLPQTGTSNVTAPHWLSKRLLCVLACLRAPDANGDEHSPSQGNRIGHREISKNICRGLAYFQRPPHSRSELRVSFEHKTDNLS